VLLYIAIGVGAVVLAVFLVLAALVWRWFRSRPAGTPLLPSMSGPPLTFGQTAATDPLYVEVQRRLALHRQNREMIQGLGELWDIHETMGLTPEEPAKKAA
jgi:hypothetical protein